MLVSPEIDRRVRSSFARQTFMTILNAKVAVVEVGHIVIEAEVGPAFPAAARVCSCWPQLCLG